MSDPFLERFEARIAERKAAARKFTVLGVDLTVKPSIAPEIANTYFDAKTRLLDFYLARDAARDSDTEPPELPDDLTDPALIDLFERTARACIEPQSVAGWEQLRAADSDDPLNWADLFQLCEYLIARASGLPTVGPSDSSDGPPATATKSKAGSRSRAATRKR